MKNNLLFLLMLLLMPMSVYANSVILSCPSEITSGSEFICELNGNSDKNITSLSAIVELGSGISFVSFIPDSVWQGDGVDGKIDLYTADGVSETFKIGIIKLKSNNDNGNVVTVNSIFFYGNDDSENNVNSVSKTVETKKVVNVDNNNDNNNIGNSGNVGSNSNTNVENDEVINSTYLVDIQIEGYELDFNKEVFDYTLKIGNENSLNIVPFLEDNSSTCIINGNENLEDGSIITLSIHDKNNKVQKYTITIGKDTVKLEEGKDYTFIFIIIIGVLVIINVARLIIKSRMRE